ncbi:DUF2509 family protein [Pantoea sp. GL120224-02]|uniref:DUF2509 family protein n=1 Tax=Pantoea sp. GL120224-02 TaxID=1378084 RepID=UPI000BD5B6C5|nr:DUF2509 family protein [Pantoea sp. GL120224-02]SNY65679.1 Protein of unknown function [Pantoea sp. GL120224-02]
MNQYGNSTLGMVLMLLLLGSLTLHATRTQLSQGMVLVADTQQHHKDFAQAQTALQWGLMQSWPAASGWQCQQQSAHQWLSCLLQMEEGNALLSGQDEKSDLRLWQWVSPRNQRLHPQAHGWIDYCPLSKPEHCQPQEGSTGL